MSILTIRSWFEHKGCQIVMILIGIALAFGLILPMFMMGGGNPFQRGGDPSNTTLVRAHGKDISLGEFENLLRQQGPSRTVVMALDTYGRAVDQLVESTAVLALAAKYQVKPTDDDLRKMTRDRAEETITMVKGMLGQQGLKPNASPKEVDEAFKKAMQTTPDEMRKRMDSELESALKTPETRARLEVQMLPQLIQAALGARTPVTEAELKASYDNFTLNRLVFTKEPTPEARMAAAEKVLAEIKGGKTFAQAYKAYMGADAPAPTATPRTTLEFDPAMKPVFAMKAGQVSDVLLSFGQPTIIQVVKVEQKLPPDFEKNKANLLKERQTTKGSQLYNEELTAMRDASLDWKNEPLRMAYAVYLANGRDRTKANKETFKKLYEETIAVSDKLAKGEPQPFNVALPLAQWVAFDQMYQLSLADQQKELKQERMDRMVAVLEAFEDNELRLQLADLQFEQKLADEGAETLRSVIAGLIGFDTTQEALAKKVEDKVATLVREKALNKEQADMVLAAATQWRADKKQMDEEEAKLRKEQEAEQKKLEEEEKKRAAEEEARLKELDKKEAEKKEAEKKAGAGAAPPAAAPAPAPAPR